MMHERYYGYWESPLGWVAVVATREKLVAIVLKETKSKTAQKLTRSFPVAVEQGSQLIDMTLVQLGEYFSGERRCFSLPLDLTGVTSFSRDVLTALNEVPFGETVSYGELAAMAGRPGAARAVGRVMASNPLPLVIPCHRVIGSGGAMTGYSGGGGIVTKKWLLDFEAQGRGQ